MSSILLQISELRSGMITDEPMLMEGRMILQKDTILTGNVISRLTAWQVRTVRVKGEVGISDGNLEAGLISRLSYEDTQFIDKYRRATTMANTAFTNMRETEEPAYPLLYKIAAFNLYDLLSSKHLLSNLYRMKPYADYTSVHAVDVGIICGLIGSSLGLQVKEIQTLILSGLMHDIGKSQIPLSILDKPGKLTDDELQTVRLHPQYGYYMTKNIHNIAPEIQHAILQHHERENGKGYPNQLPSEQIHPYAKIVAIADVYDAITTDRVYQKSTTPFAALEVLIENMYTQFDREKSVILIRYIMDMLLGSTVLLSDGTQREVLQFSAFMSAKPVVSDAAGAVLDLNREPNISVVEVLNFK